MDKLHVIKVEGKMKELDAVIIALTKKRDEEAGGAMQNLEEVLHEKQKEEAKAKSALVNKNDTLKAENKKLFQLDKQLRTVRKKYQALCILLYKVVQVGKSYDHRQ